MSDQSNDLPELPRMADVVDAIAPVERTQDELDDEEFGPRFSLKEARMQRALSAFVRSGKIGLACKTAGVTYGTWYRWREESPEFERAFLHARRILADEIEEEGMSRAKDGSDTLIQFFLKSLKPETYREKQTIEVVSHDVQERLARQADAIMELCPPDIAATLAARLREIWS